MLFIVVKKSNNEKEVHVRVRVPETENAISTPDTTSVALNEVLVDDHNVMSEYKEESSLGQPDGDMPVSGDHLPDANPTREIDPLTEAERTARENAVTKAQAAFRGYLVISAASNTRYKRSHLFTSILYFPAFAAHYHLNSTTFRYLNATFQMLYTC